MDVETRFWASTVAGKAWVSRTALRYTCGSLDLKGFPTNRNNPRLLGSLRLQMVGSGRYPRLQRTGNAAWRS